MKTKKRRQLPISVYCIKGPCAGKVFQIKSGDKKLCVCMPNDAFYKMANYKITSQITHLGEFVAIHVDNVPRKKNV